MSKNVFTEDRLAPAFSRPATGVFPGKHNIRHIKIGASFFPRRTPSIPFLLESNMKKLKLSLDELAVAILGQGAEGAAAPGSRSGAGRQRVSGRLVTRNAGGEG